MANRHGSTADLDIADGFLTRPNASDEVAEMALSRAVVNVDFVGPDRFLHDMRRFGLQDLPADTDDTFGAFENDTAEWMRPVGYLKTVVVDIREVLNIFAIGRDDLDRPGIVLVERPLDDIEMVGTPVGHAAA